MKFLKFSLLAVMMMATVTAFSQASPIGVWKTIDDETGEAKSHVEVFEKDGKLYGKVVKLLLKPDDTICDKCPGDKKDQLVLGMQILEDLKPHKDYWKNGEILDPNNGKTYRCNIWFEDGKKDELMVRGYIAFLYRTQTWYRVK